ncbi:MAG: ABC transporter ATP-binding protein [Paracoccaceae bacterium]
MSSALTVDGLRFRFAGQRGFHLSVDAFELGAGERLFLVGPSGSGKSTLLSLLCGIATPTEGSVTALGKPFSTLSGPRRDRFRAEHFGVIFQMFNLLPYATALDNVLLPLGFAPDRRRRLGPRARDEARRLLDELGLPSAATEHGPAANLSVGQQQRVAVARALIGAPEILIADEPTSALDSDTQDAFLALLFDQLEVQGGALLMVSHDARLADRFDRTVRLTDIARTGETARP